KSQCLDFNKILIYANSRKVTQRKLLVGAKAANEASCLARVVLHQGYHFNTCDGMNNNDYHSLPRMVNYD
ncbi:TPA: hypothetical protein ACPZI6_004171, partial [Yersinia enterocolitica]